MVSSKMVPIKWKGGYQTLRTLSEYEVVPDYLLHHCRKMEHELKQVWTEYQARR